MQGLDTVLKYFDDFSPTQLQQFAALESLYKEWNEKINVVSRKDIDQIYLHHVLHSLSIAAIANFNGISNKQVKKSVEGITMEFEMQKLAKVLKTKILL